MRLDRLRPFWSLSLTAMILISWSGFYEIIEASYTFGWKSFDQACIEAFEQNQITEESALLYCSKRGPTSRGIDNVKKKRGEVTTNVAGLNMKKDAPAHGAPAAPPPLTLKLK